MPAARPTSDTKRKPQGNLPEQSPVKQPWKTVYLLETDKVAQGTFAMPPPHPPPPQPPPRTPHSPPRTPHPPPRTPHPTLHPGILIGFLKLPVIQVRLASMALEIGFSLCLKEGTRRNKLGAPSTGNLRMSVSLIFGGSPSALPERHPKPCGLKENLGRHVAAKKIRGRFLRSASAVAFLSLLRRSLSVSLSPRLQIPGSLRSPLPGQRKNE